MLNWPPTIQRPPVGQHCRAFGPLAATSIYSLLLWSETLFYFTEWWPLSKSDPAHVLHWHDTGLHAKFCCRA